jgi:hypothetical protein
MPNEDRPRNDFKIKIGKLKVIPNENGEKRPPKALQFTMRVKEKK